MRQFHALQAPWRLAALIATAAALSVGIAQGQPAPAPPARPSPRASVPVDADRARQLYVPTDPALQSVGRDFERDVEAKARELIARRAGTRCRWMPARLASGEL